MNPTLDAQLRASVAMLPKVKSPSELLADLEALAKDIATVNPECITAHDRNAAFRVEMILVQIRHRSVAAEVDANLKRMKRLIGSDVAAILAKSDTDEALDGAIDKMLDSGDLDVDDEPAIPRPADYKMMRSMIDRALEKPPVVKLGQGTSETNWPPRDQVGGGR